MISSMHPKGIKREAVIDFRATHPVPHESRLIIDLQDEEVMTIKVQKGWKMHFDGAPMCPIGEKQEDNQIEKQEQGVFVNPENVILLYPFALEKGCSNNTAKYEAMILGLELDL